MIKPELHKREKERLQELDAYSILDTLPEKDYDDITSIASEICNTNISLISLLDDKRQWFKSSHGLDAKETPKMYAFCAHAINKPSKALVVEDARNDKRFHDNPLVTGQPNVVFYAGTPLISENGLPLGTLCVIDNKPHQLTERQLESLEALGRQVMNILNLRRTKLNLKKKNEELDRFAYVAAHDLKSPLANISSIARLFLEENKSSVNEEGIKMIQLLDKSALQLNKLIDGLLNFSKNDEVSKGEKSIINLEDLHKEITELFSHSEGLSLRLKSTIKTVTVNKTALKQILINLISNAIRYNDKEQTKIEIGVASIDTHYEFYVEDNGPGIPLESQNEIFEIFKMLNSEDKFGNKGSGIGLASVKKVVKKCGGTIRVSSKVHEGSKFTFTLEK